MNYITEINRFYDWLETNQVPKSAIALWNALMHINNKAGWAPSFTVAISVIESKTGFKRSELFDARNVLTQKGRIKWRSRGGNQAAEYEIIPFCVHNTDAINYAKAYTSPDTISDAESSQMPTINKLNYTETKENISVGAGAHDRPQENSDKNEEKRKRNAAPRKIFVPPSIQEVREYFLQKMGNPAIGPAFWPEDRCYNEATKFFNHYKANGWVQGKGKPLKDWHAAVANWITNCRERRFEAPPVNGYKSSHIAQSVPVSQEIPRLTKAQEEINYYFDVFCEDSSKFTVITAEASYYDLLKSAGLIDFTDDKVNEIKGMAEEHIQIYNLGNNEQNLKKYMKKFGVIEFFKRHFQSGKETVFHQPVKS